MDRKRLDFGASILASCLTVIAVAMTPGVPAYAGPSLLILAAVAVRDPHWIWCALGAALVWVPALAGAGGPVVLVGAILLVAVQRRALAVAVLGVGLALAFKQSLVIPVLPAARGPIPWLVVATVTMAGAACAGGRSGRAAGERRLGARMEAGALALAGLWVVGRVVRALTLDGRARLAAAIPLGLVPAVYDDGVAGADPALLTALVHAAPERDAAALALGWERALNEGWRPSRAAGFVVPVARALEARGRGGEAVRLLARHPRDGEIDALQALFERIQGLPVRWRGAALGPSLPGRFDPGVRFLTDGYVAVEFTAQTPLSALELAGEGTSWLGSPTIDVRLDGGAAQLWALDGPSVLRMDRRIEAGPHRLELRFVNDLAGAGGDRNVSVGEVSGT